MDWIDVTKKREQKNGFDLQWKNSEIRKWRKHSAQAISINFKRVLWEYLKRNAKM